MKKITLILTCILLSCDNSSLEQKKKRVDELKVILEEEFSKDPPQVNVELKQ